jgi:glycosyltransferase involved in cell wall biosynthesis
MRILTVTSLFPRGTAPTHAGSPNAVLESLACGTPVLVADLPEMREAVPEGRGVFAARTPEALARGLGRALALPRRQPAGRPRTWDDVAGEVLASFRRALGNRQDRIADAALAG